jgi:hypothetical protein
VPAKRGHPGSPPAPGYPGPRRRQPCHCLVPSFHYCLLPAACCQLDPSFVPLHQIKELVQIV